MAWRDEAKNIGERLGKKRRDSEERSRLMWPSLIGPWRTMTGNCYLDGIAHLMAFLGGITVAKMSSLPLCVETWASAGSWARQTSRAQGSLGQITYPLEALIPRFCCSCAVGGNAAVLPRSRRKRGVVSELR